MTRRPLRPVLAGLLLLGLALPGWVLPARAEPAPTPAQLRADYAQVSRDLARHFLDLDAGRIRPTNGGNPDVGRVNDEASPSLWQMAQYHNVLYWHWRLRHDEATRALIAGEWRYLRTIWTDDDLGSDGSQDGTVNVSDDAAWKLNYLLQVHEVLGDGAALADARAMLPRVLARFRNPGDAEARYGGLVGSAHGILYATPDGDPDHQGVSTGYEAMIAAAAASIAAETGDGAMLAYARASFAWQRRYLRHPVRGTYYCELDVRRERDGSPNPHYLVPVGDGDGPPRRGSSASYSGGTLAMGVLAARLYHLTGEAAYLQEARSVAAAFVRPDAFLRTVDGRTLFLNDRDAWTDGYWYPAFAAEALGLPGVDPDGLFRRTLANTADFIAANDRTASGHYGGDWSGPEDNGRSRSWTEQGQASQDGSGAGMALPSQIMTSSGAAAVVTAALVAAEGVRAR